MNFCHIISNDPMMRASCNQREFLTSAVQAAIADEAKVCAKGN
jgi:hypothetical protein